MITVLSKLKPMLRNFIITILLFTYSQINAQISIEHGMTWNKSSIIRPENYRTLSKWGKGKQTAIWLGMNYERPTRYKVGVIIGDQETYFQRLYPDYDLENLNATVKRNYNFFTLAGFVEQRLIRFNSFEWNGSLGLGCEFQSRVTQESKVLPSGITTFNRSSNFYPIFKAALLARTGLSFFPTKRLTLGAEAIYGTHFNLIFTRIDDKYIPHSLGLNLRASYYLGKFTIPEVK